jgi:hypothetical protein
LRSVTDSDHPGKHDSFWRAPPSVTLAFDEWLWKSQVFGLRQRLRKELSSGMKQEQRRRTGLNNYSHLEIVTWSGEYRGIHDGNDEEHSHEGELIIV